MSARSLRLRYGPVAQVFHWLTVVLVGTAYLVSPGGREEPVYSAAADFARQTHETIGILVFLTLVSFVLVGGLRRIHASRAALAASAVRVGE